MKAAAEKGTCAVNARSIAESVAGGGRFQELTLGEAGGGNRVFRLFAPDGTRILKIYESHGHQRREFHALQALGAVDGTPALIDRYEDETTTWAMFADAGKWNLGSLPENEGLARRAGAIHDSGAKVSNLARGIDADMIATDFYSAIRRLQRYRGRLRLPADLFARASAIPPPPATEPKVCHAKVAPRRFVVDDGGSVTLIGWEWATLAPLEWDLTRAVWLLSTRVGDRAAEAFQEGYGRALRRGEVERWTVYHIAMELLFKADDSLRSGSGADLDYLISKFHRSVAGA